MRIVLFSSLSNAEVGLFRILPGDPLHSCPALRNAGTPMLSCRASCTSVALNPPGLQRELLLTTRSHSGGYGLPSVQGAGLGSGFQKTGFFGSSTIYSRDPKSEMVPFLTAEQ